MTTVREDIAAALNGTELVNVSPLYRQSLKPFDGFIRFAGLGPTSNRIGWMGTWEVWVALPQDNATAEAWLDENLGTLMAALDTEAIPTTAVPADLTLGAGQSVNGLVLTGVRGFVDQAHTPG